MEFYFKNCSALSEKTIQRFSLAESNIITKLLRDFVKSYLSQSNNNNITNDYLTSFDIILVKQYMPGNQSEFSTYMEYKAFVRMPNNFQNTPDNDTAGLEDLLRQQYPVINEQDSDFTTSLVDLSDDRVFGIIINWIYYTIRSLPYVFSTSFRKQIRNFKVTNDYEILQKMVLEELKIRDQTKESRKKPKPGQRRLEKASLKQVLSKLNNITSDSDSAELSTQIETLLDNQNKKLGPLETNPANFPIDKEIIVSSDKSVINWNGTLAKIDYTTLINKNIPSLNVAFKMFENGMFSFISSLLYPARRRL